MQKGIMIAAVYKILLAIIVAAVMIMVASNAYADMSSHASRTGFGLMDLIARIFGG
ncbi:MAG: hypothetical protein V1802_02385 [Candidatus Aenigmatarchaeota archaeon]